mmetsp:Transcript_5966/g.19642  ORF Transcript_5966/g.19642 Transcript_5966/m.19642 type:complete len:222 (-) Transcript_5966:7-672(-)
MEKGLADGGEGVARERAERLLGLRHLPPPHNLEPLERRLRLEKVLRLLRRLGLLRQKRHRDAHRVGGLAAERAVRLEEAPRHRRHHARPVARHAVAATPATVLHAAQRVQRPCDDVVVVAPLGVGEEADAARVALADQRHRARLRHAQLTQPERQVGAGEPWPVGVGGCGGVRGERSGGAARRDRRPRRGTHTGGRVERSGGREQDQHNPTVMPRGSPTHR